MLQDERWTHPSPNNNNNNKTSSLSSSLSKTKTNINPIVLLSLVLSVLSQSHWAGVIDDVDVVGVGVVLIITAGMIVVVY